MHRTSTLTPYPINNIDSPILHDKNNKTIKLRGEEKLVGHQNFFVTISILSILRYHEPKCSSPPYRFLLLLLLHHLFREPCSPTDPFLYALVAEGGCYSVVLKQDVNRVPIFSHARSACMDARSRPNLN